MEPRPANSTTFLRRPRRNAFQSQAATIRAMQHFQDARVRKDLAETGDTSGGDPVTTK